MEGAGRFSLRNSLSVAWLWTRRVFRVSRLAVVSDAFIRWASVEVSPAWPAYMLICSYNCSSAGPQGVAMGTVARPRVGTLAGRILFHHPQKVSLKSAFKCQARNIAPA